MCLAKHSMLWVDVPCHPPTMTKKHSYIIQALDIDVFSNIYKLCISYNVFLSNIYCLHQKKVLEFYRSLECLEQSEQSELSESLGSINCYSNVQKT